MKRVIPIALMLLLSFSMSGFVPVTRTAATHKSVWDVPFPLTGTTSSLIGTLNYSISGSGSSPFSITLSQGSTVIGTYTYSNGGSGNIYRATGMQAATGIQEAVFYITGWSPGYYIEFISPF
jgi:hypothetical protein